MWKPIHASSFGTLPRGDLVFCNILIWFRFVRSGRNGSSPFFRRFLDGFRLAGEIGSCFHKSDLGRIGLSFVRVLFLRSSVCRACGLPTRCSLYAHDFLQATTWIEHRRREVSPLLEWRFASRRTVMRGRRGIFAPSHHHLHLRLSSRESRKAP